jgi:hypothetical protein
MQVTLCYPSKGPQFLPTLIILVSVLHLTYIQDLPCYNEILQEAIFGLKMGLFIVFIFSSLDHFALKQLKPHCNRTPNSKMMLQKFDCFVKGTKYIRHFTVPALGQHYFQTYSQTLI